MAETAAAVIAHTWSGKGQERRELCRDEPGRTAVLPTCSSKHHQQPIREPEPAVRLTRMHPYVQAARSKQEMKGQKSVPICLLPTGNVPWPVRVIHPYCILRTVELPYPFVYLNISYDRILTPRYVFKS